MASDQVIIEIKDRLDIVEYIGRTVNLTSAGRTFKANCPFHAENTPSFFVFPQTNTWHCFGACSEGGDIFSFVQKREGLTFPESLELLAQESGIKLSQESPQQQQMRVEQERLYSLCEAASALFQKWLRDHPDGKHCREYVKQRNLLPETVHRFGLGYAPNSWDNLLNTLSVRGYEPRDMVEVGLARERKRDSRSPNASPSYYDALRNRLVFPIRDLRGRIIGFGGRSLEDEQQPKYLNSSQSIIFDKSSVLYGLDLAKNAIRQQKRAVIVEGYMDVIAAHQAGFTNVVASLGTALTAEQIRQLTRYSLNLTLALDADYAGQKAAKRGLETILALQKEQRRTQRDRARRGQGTANYAEGDIRVLTLPEGYDPDDLISTSLDSWVELLKNALPVIDYLITNRLENANVDDPVEKTRIVADLLPTIGSLESAVIRDHYIRQLARALKTDERVLSEELLTYRQSGATSASRGQDRRREDRRREDRRREDRPRQNRPRADREKPERRDSGKSAQGEPPAWHNHLPDAFFEADQAHLDFDPGLLPIDSVHELPAPPEWLAAPYGEENGSNEPQSELDIEADIEPDIATWQDTTPVAMESSETSLPLSTSPFAEGVVKSKRESLGQLEDYLLYLFLERPGFLPEAVNYGLRSDMWQETINRQIWDALTSNTPTITTHLEEFLAELDTTVEKKVQEIITYYANKPQIESKEWMFEALNRLDHFLIRYEERQAHQLHYLLDELQRNQEGNRQILDKLGQQLLSVGFKRLQWQRQQQQRIDKRKENV